jgi:hypothetical protein
VVDRGDWLLAFICAPGADRFLTDQIRVMKGMFLLSKEGPPDLRDLYAFEPYDYGPFDKHVYGDLDQLEAEGLIHSETVGGSNRRIFRATPRGQERFAQICASAHPDAMGELRRVKGLVSSMGFMELLLYVYDRHPDYAVSSVIDR